MDAAQPLRGGFPPAARDVAEANASPPPRDEEAFGADARLVAVSAVVLSASRWKGMGLLRT